MSGATVGILGYSKRLGSASSLPSAPSMFTLKGNGLAVKLCQPGTVNNYDLHQDNNRDQTFSSMIRPLSHGITLPQLSQQSVALHHRTPLHVSHSRNSSALLVSPSCNSIIKLNHMRPSAFSNFRITEQGGRRDRSSRSNEDKFENKWQPRPTESYTATSSTIDYKQFLKDDDTILDFKSSSDCATVSSEYEPKPSLLHSRSTKPVRRKKKAKFHKNNGRKSRCKTRRDQKRGKLKMHFSNHNQDAMKSFSASASITPILQVQAVSGQRSWNEVSDKGDCREISRTNSNSSTKSFRLSSSQTSLSSEVFQRASAIYSNLKNSGQGKEECEKVRRVYQSEKQSGVIKDCGIVLPCAPPCSPTVDQLKRVEYVASMNDIRSQRAVKYRLSQMESKAKKKELARKEEAKRTEKQLLKDQELIKKQHQRLKIYALNKIMTELEEKQFQDFCRIMKSGKEDSNPSSTNDKMNLKEKVNNSEET